MYVIHYFMYWDSISLHLAPVVMLRKYYVSIHCV